MNTTIEIDGSHGEGGGQVLRSSLALSMVTGRPFRISNIRAGRAKPGLMRQHLTCVQAAAAICGGHAVGAAVGSAEVSFTPGTVTPGSYHFPIGTAGSTTMVLQAILPALLAATGPSTVTVEGGTHNKSAPPFDFFVRALVPLLNQMGPTVRARIDRPGFYPAGGGRITVDVEPAPAPRAFELLERGRSLGHSAVAMVSQLSPHIAHRELDVIRERLGLTPDQTRMVDVESPVGPGNVVLIELQYEFVTEVFSAVGEFGKSAQLVGREASDGARAYIASERPVGQHLADQLMVPLAVLAGGRYATDRPSGHFTTNITTIKAFGGHAAISNEGIVEVRPMDRPRTDRPSPKP